MPQGILENMTTATKPTDLSSLGRIFAEPSAYADPVAWHAAAKRLREEAPIIKVSLPDYPEFYAITKHADVMEIERNPEVFTNAPIPALATISEREAGGDTAGMKTLVQMDGDEHRAHRIIVNEWFKPRNVTQDAGARRRAGQAVHRPDGGHGRRVRLRQGDRDTFPVAGDPVDPRAARVRLREDAEAHPGVVRSRGPRHRPGRRGRHSPYGHDGFLRLLHPARRRPPGATRPTTSRRSSPTPS